MRILYFITLCVTLSATAVYGQAYQKQKKKLNARKDPNSQFLEKQFWLGFKGGINFSKAIVDQSYAVLAPANYEASEKKYDDYAGIGAHATVEVTFSFRQVSISFQPTYRNSKFTYSNAYEWIDQGEPQLILNYKHEQKVDWAELPLLVKYDLTRTKLSPYIQLGAYYAFMINANKSVQTSGIDYASGGTNNFTEPDIIVGAQDLFAKKHWGLMFGAGANYQLGNVRINLDVMYRKGMSLVNSTENRYGNDRLAGTGDVLDDIKLNNIGISLGCLFPMRFLTSGFQSTGKR